MRIGGRIDYHTCQTEERSDMNIYRMMVRRIVSRTSHTRTRIKDNKCIQHSNKRQVDGCVWNFKSYSHIELLWKLHEMEGSQIIKVAAQSNHRFNCVNLIKITRQYSSIIVQLNNVEWIKKKTYKEDPGKSINPLNGCSRYSLYSLWSKLSLNIHACHSV